MYTSITYIERRTVYEGKPDVWYRKVIPQRKHKRKGLAIYISDTGDQSEFFSRDRNTKAQLEPTEATGYNVNNNNLFDPWKSFSKYNISLRWKKEGLFTRVTTRKMKKHTYAANFLDLLQSI